METWYDGYMFLAGAAIIFGLVCFGLGLLVGCICAATSGPGITVDDRPAGAEKQTWGGTRDIGKFGD